MSTSPEAKQAARALWVGLPWTHEQLSKTEIAFQQFADAATAKPTPDVEKIARRATSRIIDRTGLGSGLYAEVRAMIQGALAQARAPLVAVLEDVRKFIAADQSPTFHGKVAYLAAIDAALTGTGKK